MAMQDEQKIRTGGFRTGWGDPSGAFTTTMSGGKPPGAKKASAAPGGISLRGGNSGGLSTVIRPNNMASITQRAAGYPRQEAPGKQGMTHYPPKTGFMPQMPNPGFGYSGSGNDYAAGALPPPTTPPPEVEAPAAAASPAQTQAEMIAEQNEGIGGSVETGRMGPQGISQGAMLEEQTPGGKFAPEEISPGVFRDDSPGAGMGAASYSDSASGTSMGAFSNTGQMGLQRDGNVAYASNFGPFGRTPEEQTAIENRVGEIQRATDFIRGMRDIPTELDRMKQQAGANISLDQGLGGFLQAGANRNYARDRVTELEALGAEDKKLATDALQQQFDNNMAMANLQKGVFDATYTEDAQGNRIPVAMNNVTGEMLRQQPGSLPLTPEQHREEATKEVDAALEASPWWKLESSVLKGKTREEAIEAAYQKRINPQQAAPQQGKADGQPQLRWGKDDNGKTVAFQLVNGKWEQRG